MRQLIVLLLLLWHAWQMNAQTALPILDRKVTLKITNQPLAKVLNIISETANFNFSYGTSVKVNRNVTILAENRTVREILDQLFNQQITYQQIGNHLILQRKIIPKNTTQIQESTEKLSKYNYRVTGYIRDLKTGDGIANVSVYERQSLASSLSGDFGYFELPVTSKENKINIRYSIQGYSDTTIEISFTNNGLIELNLNLKNKAYPIVEGNFIESDTFVETIAQTAVDTANKIAPDSTITIIAWAGLPFKNVKVSETQMGKWFINNYQRLTEKNISDSFYRQWQFTVIPPIGSNGRLSGFVTNRFSVNAFIGYNGGVDGAEFGGFLNIVKRQMKGAQFGGFGNMVGGSVDGVQFAGFFNHNFGHLNGAQFAGFYNFNHGENEGFQGAGFFNINLKNANGAQAAGFLNVNLGNFNGVQGAGFVNMNGADFNGIQAAGFVNANRGDMNGSQLAGFVNVNGKHVNGIQIAGFVNVAKEVDGGQLAGFLNIAKKVRGFQIGIINIADTLEGITLGLINFIRTGLHQIELNRNENNYGIAYRSGTRKFYSVVLLNSQLPIKDSNTIMGYGFGIGTAIKLAKPLYLTIDLTSQHLTLNFLSDHLNLQNRLSAGLEYKVMKGVAIFGSASLNHMIADTRDYHYGSYFKNYGAKPIWNNNGTYNQHAWIGYQFGVRLL